MGKYFSLLFIILAEGSGPSGELPLAGVVSR